MYLRVATRGSGLGGAALASGDVLDHTPIRSGERLSLTRFDRQPGVPTWIAVIQRESGHPSYIPVGAAIKLGLTTEEVRNRLAASIDPAALEDEVAMMARQARLDTIRHAGEALDNIWGWVKAYWWAVPLGFAAAGAAGAVGGLTFGALLGVMEEVYPGAGAQIAEDLLKSACYAPVTAVPASLLGACKEVGQPWWVTPLVVGGIAIGTLILLKETGVLAAFRKSHG